MDQLFEFIGNHPFLIGTFVLVLALFVRNEAARGGRGVSPQELVNLVNKEGALVLDVRDAKEFKTGHIVDARNIPHGSLDSRIPEIWASTPTLRERRCAKQGSKTFGVSRAAWRNGATRTCRW
jgi:hypothetical protein